MVAQIEVISDLVFYVAVTSYCHIFQKEIQLLLNKTSEVQDNLDANLTEIEILRDQEDRTITRVVTNC